MNRFKLGVEAFIHELNDHIAFTKLSPHRDPLIERFEVFDEETAVLHNDCLYLCIDDALPPCKHVQPGTCIISCDKDRICGDSSCTRCNLIALKDMTPKALVNAVSALFDRYVNACHDLELHAGSDADLPVFLNIAQQMLRMPLAVMDEKLDIVMTSDCKELYPNPLWETIIRDRKPQRSELLDNQNGTIYKLRSDGDAVPLMEETSAHIHTFADYESASCNIRMHAVPTGTLWAFQTKPDQHFEPHELNLLSWMASRLDQWALATKLLHPSRGNKRERYLIDLLRGDFGTDEAYAKEAAAKVDVKAAEGPDYQLILLKPNIAVRPEKMIKAIEELEAAVPRSTGVLREIGAIMLVPIGDELYLSAKERRSVQGICQRYSLFAMVSSTYRHLTDTPSVLRQIQDSFRFVDAKSGECGVYHYYNYMLRQSMHLVMDNQPVETMLHPMIRKLIAYDREYHTDYLETFKIYLNNRCNVTETAKQLHMHRNTLLHRVKRIEELLDSSFDDWQLRRMLLLSFDYLYLNQNRDI